MKVFATKIDFLYHNPKLNFFTFQTIYSLFNKVKNGGKIFILDQKELIEKERSFVLWDYEEHSEISIQYANISEQIAEYKKTPHSKK